MPFVVMLYLMMMLTQLHGTLWRSTVLAQSDASFDLAASLSDFRHEVGWTKADTHIYLPGERTPYTVGDFVPP